MGKAGELGMNRHSLADPIASLARLAFLSP